MPYRHAHRSVWGRQFLTEGSTSQMGQNDNQITLGQLKGSYITKESLFPVNGLPLTQPHRRQSLTAWESCQFWVLSRYPWVNINSLHLRRVISATPIEDNGCNQPEDIHYRPSSSSSYVISNSSSVGESWWEWGDQIVFFHLQLDIRLLCYSNSIDYSNRYFEHFDFIGA